MSTGLLIILVISLSISYRYSKGIVSDVKIYSSGHTGLEGSECSYSERP